MQLNPFHKNFRSRLMRPFHESALVTVARSLLGKKTKQVLVYCGANRGTSLGMIFNNYQQCYAFEADPNLFALLKNNYKYCKQVHIYNYAVTDYDGEIEFNVCERSKDVSSIGKLSNTAHKTITDNSGDPLSQTIIAKCIHLGNFLTANGVTEIDDYISDIQGFDLHVLTTLKPLITASRIKSVQSEVSAKNNLYKDNPVNSETGFNELLGDKYKLVARVAAGIQKAESNWSGLIADGTFNEIPPECWDYDCRWELK